MTALLINPFIYDFAAFDFWAKPRGLLEVAGLFKSMGFDVEWLDCMDPDDEAMRCFASSRPSIRLPASKKFGAGSYFQEEQPKPERLKDFPRKFYRYGFHPEHLRARLRNLQIRPSVIALTSIMTYWWKGLQETAAIVRAEFPETPILLGGIYATLLPEHARQNICADHVHEGSLTREQLRAVLAKLNVPIAEDANRHAFARHQLFYPYPRCTYGITALSVGCKGRCTYCACWKLHSEWHPYPLEQPEYEVQQFYASGRMDIALYDDDLLYDFDNLAGPFFRTMAQRYSGLRFHAGNGLYLKRMNYDRACLLREAGLETLRFGFETADAALSLRIGHKISKYEFTDRVADLLKAGFHSRQIGIYLMVGLPGQTPEQVAESIEFVKECGLRPNLTEFSPVPGTPEYESEIRVSKLEIQDEPFYQNNTLLPLRSAVFDFKTLNDLKNRCAKSIRAEGQVD